MSPYRDSQQRLHDARFHKWIGADDSVCPECGLPPEEEMGVLTERYKMYRDPLSKRAIPWLLEEITGWALLLWIILGLGGAGLLGAWIGGMLPVSESGRDTARVALGIGFVWLAILFEYYFILGGRKPRK